MSTDLCEISDETGKFDTVTVTSYTGPVSLGEDRRCIQISGTCPDVPMVGWVQMTLAQWNAVRAACAPNDDGVAIAAWLRAKRSEIEAVFASDEQSRAARSTLTLVIDHIERGLWRTS